MSEKGVQAFYAKADTDEELGKQLAQVAPGDGALDQVVKIAAGAGFEVTTSEIISVENAVQGPEGEGLSDEELSTVAGGHEASVILDVSFVKGIKRLDIRDRSRVVAMSNAPTVSAVARHQARWNK